MNGETSYAPNTVGATLPGPLARFAPAVQWIDSLQQPEQVAAFDVLAQRVHALDLDWWLTPKSLEPRAGRSENIYWHTSAVMLALRATAAGVELGLNKTHDMQDSQAAFVWQALTPEAVEQALAWLASVAGHEYCQRPAHRPAYWPEDYLALQRTLCTKLTDGALNNDYLAVSAELAPRFFPAQVLGTADTPAPENFEVQRADGKLVSTYVRGNRLRDRTLFTGQSLQPGDYALLTEVAPLHYALRFLRQADMGVAPAAASSLAPDMISAESHEMTMPLNQILYGPPGTGKTYATVTKTLEILEPQWLADLAQGTLTGAEKRQQMKQRFDALHAQGRVTFTTFHQSFSYEDFVEGIRADIGSGEGEENLTALSYRIEPGVFKRLCEDAQRDPVAEAEIGISPNAKVWKLSIEEASSDGKTRAYCFAHGEARIGWGGAGDLQSEAFEKDDELGVKEKSSLRNFGFGIQPGDVVVVLKTVRTIQAVGVVTGPYEYELAVPQDEGVREDYLHKLPVHWLATGIDFDVTALNSDTQLTLQTVYRLWKMSWPQLLQALLDAKVPLKGIRAPSARTALPYVLVIDEINRGNVSRIFGELITLLESSKRAGAPEALSVTLPYSKQSFSVPGNVYIIGTMNTTDRSLAGLDVALRRRFEFEELMPTPKVLADVTVTEGAVSVNIAQLLLVMNERIEALLDREHQLGHAYFTELSEDASLPRLAQIFKSRVIPLLQEYFFDDWERIAWVLNDHRKPKAQRFVTKHGRSLEALFGGNDVVQAVDKRWRINDDAFNTLGSFKAVIEVDRPSAAIQSEQLEAASAGSSN